MRIVVIDRHGYSLDYENKSLVVRAEGLTPKSIPLRYIRRLICMHSTEVTTRLLGKLWEEKVDFVVINNRYSQRSFALHSNLNNQVIRRSEQYAWQKDELASLAIAKVVCIKRLKNCRLLVAKNRELVKLFDRKMLDMRSAVSLDQLRGLEGFAQKMFLQHLAGLVPESLGFTKRVRRPATDPVNALISLTATMAIREAVNICVKSGLDAQLGFYHRASFGRDSLACDLVEVVRPFMEKWVVGLFVSGKLDARFFTKSTVSNPGVFLGKEGREVFYKLVDGELVEWRKKITGVARWLAYRLDNSTLEEMEWEGLAVA